MDRLTRGRRPRTDTFEHRAACRAPRRNAQRGRRVVLGFGFSAVHAGFRLEQLHGLILILSYRSAIKARISRELARRSACKPLLVNTSGRPIEFCAILIAKPQRAWSTSGNRVSWRAVQRWQRLQCVQRGVPLHLCVSAFLTCCRCSAMWADTTPRRARASACTRRRVASCPRKASKPPRLAQAGASPT